MVENENIPKPGEFVWIKPIKNGEFQLPWSGKIINKSYSKFKVLNDEGEVFDVDPSAINGLVHPSDVDPVNDMINLFDLSEHSILRNIRLRYHLDLIYTYTGGILIAINPYKSLDIYSDDLTHKYQGKRLFEQDPHIFAVGAQALENLKRHFYNQCIVISGETGSGKTESTKFLLNFLAASSSKSSIGKKIIQANPILEEFGNAKTTHNDNSSRFGKFIEIYFKHDGTMKCASIKHYLLEKSRIKSQNKGNRNYHIFYSLLAGLPQDLKTQMKLTTPKDYFYLNQGSSVSCVERNENEEFSKLSASFLTLNFNDREILCIFQLLACILHIGNFIYKMRNDSDEGGEIVQNAHLQTAINLLSVEDKSFIQALTHKTLFVEGTKVVSRLTIEQAKRIRDGFSMSLYNHLFSFILKTINKSISNHKVFTSPSIGILDIFGFEDFEHNSFEQFCINYANENLQQFFIGHIFKLEQEEYIRENIKWECFSYEDNKEVLHLLGYNKTSILSILDEQTKFPTGSNRAFLLQCNKTFYDNKNYVKKKSEASLEFGIQHYAGCVSYSVEGFIEKNMNTLGLEWYDLIRDSGNQFLKDLYIKELNSEKNRSVTLAGQYKQSLESLMTTLASGTPFFIRCIKPNSSKQPNEFDNELVCRQLRYTGMMETVRIRQNGYPIRYSYEQFVIRYRILVPGSPPVKKIKNFKETAKTVCEKYLDEKDYQFGKTKVFLKIPDEKLETIRDQIFSASAIVLQKYFKGALGRIRFLKTLKAAIIIQRYWRGYKPRFNYRVIQSGYLRLQAVLRSRQLKHDYKKLRLTVIRLQALCRGVLVRRKFSNMKEMKKNHSKNPLKAISKSSKNSLPQMWIDDYITNVFDSAVEERNSSSNDYVSYLNPNDNVNLKAIMKTPGTLSFQKFASANFMGNVNHKFSKKIIDQPLLEMTSNADIMAAKVIWMTILRFMGDLQENVALKKRTKPKTREAIMNLLAGTVSKSFLHSEEYINIVNALKLEEQKLAQENFMIGKKQLKNLSLSHRNKLKNEIKRTNLEMRDLKSSYEEWLTGPVRTLKEKLYFIIGHGIMKPSLRDEIYCQICKQLTDNSDPASVMYGWILMTLCASSFPPSSKLAPTLLHFLAKGGNMLGCVIRLQRTLENGPRTQPPTAFELNALKHKEKMQINIHLLDDSSVTLDVDPATTAQEICKGVCTKLNLEDSFGFSVFVSIFGQTISLENGNWFLMDAVSQCESKASEKRVPEIKAPWTVVFRREMFQPWPISFNDSVSTNLTYVQIIKGLAIGDYKCSQQCELANLVAQHYYISCGKLLLPEILGSVLKEVIPKPLLKQSHTNWSKAVTDSFKKSYFLKMKIPEGNVKANVVRYAQKKWSLLFSKYYEIRQTAGIYLGSSDLLLAVNADGLMFVKNSMDVLMKITYMEIDFVEFIACGNSDEDQLHIYTLYQQQYVFITQYADIISKLVNSILDELIMRSRFAIANDDYSPPDDSFLKLRKGDLIILTGNEGDGKWLKGKHFDSGNIGEFPRKIIKILPCIETPPLHILELHSNVLHSPVIKKYPIESKDVSLQLKKHSLELYASRYFRSGNFHTKGHKQELWQFSSEKIFSPLHQSLSSLSHLVIPMFDAILHYMGDRTQIGKPRYTRTIFEPPLLYEVLHDELYCLLLKQMTDNPSESSMSKGWELLLLATSLFPPSSVTKKDVEQWLGTRPCELSGICLQNLKIAKFLDPRKRCHHWLEVSAAQNKIPLLHPVTFPNNMEHIFELKAFTKVKDLIEIISRWLGLKTSEGFSLIVVFEDTAISLPANEYLFDAILDACRFPATAEGHDTPKYEYDLMFVKKLWINTYAGMDKIADVVCHYYQELPKYLAGSHNCTVDDAMYLGALIFIAQMDEHSNIVDPTTEIANLLLDLIPEQLLQELDHQEWIYGLVRAYEKNKELKSDEAKIMFLEETQNWPNFGSAFFGVHISSSMQDDQKTLVVNRNGVCLVHPHAQEVVSFFTYSEILDCPFKENSFTLNISNHSYVWYSKSSKKIADLISSYIQVFDSKYFMH